jgi:hypothetical protein
VLRHSLNFAQSFFGFCHSAQSFYVFIGDFVIFSVILCFPLPFCEAQRRGRQGRRRGVGGRGVDGRGAGRRRMRCSLAGTRRAEEARASVGEAMGGGRGAH